MIAGVLARDASGKLADMPRDLAGSLNGTLMDVLVLIQSARFFANDLEGEPGAWELLQIFSMADEKVSAMADTLQPYV